MTSASALNLHCGYPRVLGRTVAKSARSQAACDLGTLFHGAVELWGKSGDLAATLAGITNDEVRGWLELLAMTWAPAKWMHLEYAVGLSPDGGGVAVDEPEPHVYVARNGSPLLTAGRADVVTIGWHPDDPRRPGGGDGRRVVWLRDWKTGKYPAPPVRENLQLSALALAAAAMFDADAFVREIYYTRDGYLDADPSPVMLDSDEAAEAWERVERAAKLDEQPRTGAHCLDCWDRRLKRCAEGMKVTA